LQLGDAVGDDPGVKAQPAALNRVPGRVLVKGHTDDQPVGTGRFRDNFDLSRQRALNVVAILKVGIDNAGRLQHTGVGSTEPLDPANRALNRRVEIVHVRGS
jgi:type VI secretion system protein ImpK